MPFIKVADNPNLCRDSNTGAIINISDKPRDSYLKRKQAIQQQKQHQANVDVQINQLNDRINNLEDKLNTIIDLLCKR